MVALCRGPRCAARRVPCTAALCRGAPSSLVGSAACSVQGRPLSGLTLLGGQRGVHMARPPSVGARFVSPRAVWHAQGMATLCRGSRLYVGSAARAPLGAALCRGSHSPRSVAVGYPLSGRGTVNSSTSWEHGVPSSVEAHGRTGCAALGGRSPVPALCRGAPQAARSVYRPLSGPAE